AVVRLTVAVVAGDRAELRVELLAAEAHRVIQRVAPRHRAAAGLGTALPIVHVVLLEGAAGAEDAGAGEADRVLDLLWRGLVGVDPGPDLRLVGAARMPDPQGARGWPQDRQ